MYLKEIEEKIGHSLFNYDIHFEEEFIPNGEIYKFSSPECPPCDIPIGTLNIYYEVKRRKIVKKKDNIVNKSPLDQIELGIVMEDWTHIIDGFKNLTGKTVSKASALPKEPKEPKKSPKKVGRPKKVAKKPPKIVVVDNLDDILSDSVEKKPKNPLSSFITSPKTSDTPNKEGVKRAKIDNRQIEFKNKFVDDFSEARADRNTGIIYPEHTASRPAPKYSTLKCARCKKSFKRLSTLVINADGVGEENYCDKCL